jgi:hyaluronan synthase
LRRWPILIVIDVLGFTWITLSLTASYMHQDIRVTNRQRSALNGKRVSVVVPVYNEDPTVFRAMLDSISAQTRLPQYLHVVDDGSKTRDCEYVFYEWLRTKPASLAAVYTTIPNSKKRHAQAVAFKADTQADFWVTIDSDTVLKKNAIEEGINPFSRKKIMAVAGLLVSLNDDKNLLTRLVDLGFTMSFLNGRASWSFLRSVVVSCGGLAFYRGEVIRKYLDVYLTQTVWGRKVSSGDDRMLTCYALMEGQTVLQESSMGYTLMPENLSHLTRQRVRWWRSFFWGGGWLIQNFSLRKPAWWLVTWQFVSFVLFSFALPAVLVIGPIKTSHVPWEFFVYMATLSYITSMKFLTLRRPDRTTRQLFFTWLLAPLSSILHLYLCSILQYVGLFTFGKTGWSTRQSVEVSMVEIKDVVPT